MQFNTRNIAVGIATLITCGAIGYFVTKAIKGKDAPPAPELRTTTQWEYHTNRVTEQDTVIDLTYKVSYKYSILGDDTISVLVDSTFEDKVYVSIPEPIKPGDDEQKKIVTIIKPVPNPIVIPENKEPAPPKMTKSEVRQMLLSGDIDYKKVSMGVRMNVTGRKGDDKAPSDPMDVYNKKSTDTWSDFRVTDLKCDDEGNITSITVRPVYPTTANE